MYSLATQLFASWTANYDGIQLVSVREKKFWLVNKDSYKGIVDLSGKILLPAEYASLNYFTNDVPYVAVITEYDLRGAYDPINEKMVVPPLYTLVMSDITNFVKKGGFWVQSNGWWGYYDTKGELIIPTTLQCQRLERKGQYCIMKHGEYSVLIDSCGSVIIPSGIYNNIKPLSNGKICVFKDHHAGVCDEDGELLFMTSYNDLDYDPIQKNYIVNVGKNQGHISLSGNDILKPSRQSQEYNVTSGNYSYTLKCNQEGLYGIERNGQKILPCEYDSITQKGDFFYLYNAGFMGLARKDGKIIIPIGACHHINKIKETGQDFIFGQYYNKIRLYTYSGREFVSADIYTDSGLIFYHGDHVLVQTGNNKGICDTLGHIIVEPRYSKIEDFASKYYRVFIGNLCGMYNLEGKCVVPPLYTSVTHYYNNKEGWEFFKVYDDKNNKQGLYSVDGKMIIPTDEFTYVDVKSSTIIAQSDKRTCKFTIEGKMFYDSYQEDSYDKYFNLGGKCFEHKQYRKAIDNYQQALTYRKTASAYFNIAASYYNIEHYQDAITYYNFCLNANPSSALALRAREDIQDARRHISNMSSRRMRIAQMVIGGVHGLTTALLQANNISYSNPAIYNPYNPYSNYSQNITSNTDYNQVFNQLYQQTLQQTSYEMAQQQQLMNNMMYVSYQQTKQQFELEYQEFSRYFKKPDGTDYTYEEWEQMRAQTYHTQQHREDQNNNETSISYSGKLSPEQYQQQYKRYENLVKSWFGNLSHDGKYLDKDGNIKGGTESNMPSSAYIGNKMGLYDAQEQMRRIRQEAESAGVYIQQSKWETATTSF